MNNVSKNRALVSIIAILLITNIVMLLFFFNANKNKASGETHKPGFTERVRTEVKFDSVQMALYDVKRKAHWKSMRLMFDDITATKEKFYQLLYDRTVSDSLVESRAAVIGDKQKALDLQVFLHFKDIRKLCRPEQLPAYDSLLPVIIKRMTELPGKK